MIQINGNIIDKNSINLMEYLENNGFNKNRVAIELNGEIVKRGTYGEYVLSDGDKVEIVCFVGGG